MGEVPSSGDGGLGAVGVSPPPGKFCENMLIYAFWCIFRERERERLPKWRDFGEGQIVNPQPPTISFHISAAIFCTKLKDSYYCYYL